MLWRQINNAIVVALLRGAAIYGWLKVVIHCVSGRRRIVSCHGLKNWF